MLLTLVALVAAVVLLVYLVWLRRTLRRTTPTGLPPAGDERRAEHALFLRLLEGLDTLDDRYRIFTYRVLRAVALVGLGCAVALAFNGKLLDDTHDLAEQQRSGRAIAIDALCGAVSGVVDAGRATILQGASAPQTDFTRALEKLGYPPIKVRRDQAHAAAAAYGRVIAKAVEDATKRPGVKPAKLTRKDGTLDCSRLKRASGADSAVR